MPKKKIESNASIRKINNKNTKEKRPNNIKYSNAPTFDELSIQDRTYLGAVLRAHLVKKDLMIDLENNTSLVFAPTSEYRDFILATLLDRNIITPYEVDYSQNQKVFNENSYSRFYDVCISDPAMSKIEIIFDLMYPDKVSAADEYIAFHILCEVKNYEAVEYMMLVIKKFGLVTFEADASYDVLFSKILSDYSESQLFNFIYNAIKNIATYRKKYNNKYLPISKLLYKSITDNYAKAQLYNWNIPKFNRVPERPQSEISKLVNNNLFCLGESSFYE